jgi:hypothetical protein
VEIGKISDKTGKTASGGRNVLVMEDGKEVRKLALHSGETGIGF